MEIRKEEEKGRWRKAVPTTEVVVGSKTRGLRSFALLRMTTFLSW